VLLAIILAGCSHVTETTRQIVRQTKLIGSEFKDKVDDPVAKQAFADTEANMQSVEDTVGPPKKNPAVTYSPAESQRLREKQTTINETWKWGWANALGIIEGILALAGLTLPPVVKKLMNEREKVTAVVQGGEDVIEAFPEMKEKIISIMRKPSETSVSLATSVKDAVYRIRASRKKT